MASQKELKNRVFLLSFFLIITFFFLHYEWDGVLQNLIFVPSFILVFIALYDTMRKWATIEKRRRSRNISFYENF